MMNPMMKVRIEKVTLNIGAGKDMTRLEKGMKLLKNITESTPVKTVTQKRIPGWGLRPGLPIGCKVTLRGKKAIGILKRLIYAKENMLNEKQFDDNGNLSFGIPEYIDIQNIKYDPEIGIMGLEVCVTLERPGFRIKRRKIKNKKKISNRHKIKKNEAIDFMKKEFNIRIKEEK